MEKNSLSFTSQHCQQGFMQPYVCIPECVALVRTLRNSSATHSQQRWSILRSFAMRRGVRDLLCPSHWGSLPFAFSSMSHLRAALAIRQQRVPGHNGHIYEVLHSAEACATD